MMFLILQLCFTINVKWFILSDQYAWPLFNMQNAVITYDCK